MEKEFFFLPLSRYYRGHGSSVVDDLAVSVLTILEREPVVDYPTFLWSDYPTDYPISDTRPPVVVV